MRRKVGKIKSNLKSKIIILIIVGIFLALLPINSNIHDDDITLDQKLLRISAVSGKIHIDNNWTATESTYSWCTGSGTWNDPYIIQDLIIDSGGSGSCIWIQNSDVYFRIENCTVYNSGGDWGDAGISLINVNNGTLIENNCSFNAKGIWGAGINLDGSNNNTISGNTANNNNFGIKLYLSNNSKVSGNFANNNIDSGINLGETDNTNVSGNLVLNNGGGIFLDDSNYIRIFNNTANHNNYTGIGLGNTNYNGQLIQNNCSFNGEGITFESNCENNTVQGNIVNSNTDYGINLMESSNNYVMENTVNNNGNMGINLSPNSSYNEIVNNTVNFNGFGIHFNDNSANNLILDNNCNHNIYGIIVRTPNNTISGNYVEYNSVVGMHFWSADAYNNTQNNNITRNFIYNNNYGIKFTIEVGGFFGSESALNLFEGNRISDNTRGFEIDAGCNDNLIFNNTFSDNSDANAVDNGNNNKWNSSTLGNNWDDYTGKDTNDDGVGDTLYSISGAAGSQDNNPIWWDAPVISIISPVVNASFQNAAPQFSISIEGVPNSMWYTIEGILGNFPFTEVNFTIDQPTWDNLTNGPITVTIYAQDSESEIGTTSIIVIKYLPSTPTPDGIPGYNLFFLLGTISVVAIVISTKLKKFNK